MSDLLAQVAENQNKTTKSDATRRATAKTKTPLPPVEGVAGLDAGNSTAVIAFGYDVQSCVMMPSCVYSIPKPAEDEALRCPPRTYPSGEGVTIEIGHEIHYLGKSAIQAGGQLVSWTGSGDQSTVMKPRNAPLFLIAAAATKYPQARHVKLSVYAGIHQESMKKPMMQSLAGTHQCHILTTAESGEIIRRPLTLEVDVLSILFEDQGALFNAAHVVTNVGASGRSGIIPLDKSVAVIGIGGGTTNISVFEGPKPVQMPVPKAIGGLPFIRAICQHPTLTQMLANRGYHQIGGAPFDAVKEGIESGTFEIGDTGVNFRPVYNLLLESNLVNPVLTHAAEWFSPSSVAAILVTGGGAMMPDVVEKLKASPGNSSTGTSQKIKGFPPSLVVSTGMGHIDTAVGFYRLAARRLGK